MKPKNPQPVVISPETVRLLNKKQVCALVGASYQSLWMWMRAGKFPRSREVVGKSMWISTEIEAWMTQLPIRQLKPEDPPENKRKFKDSDYAVAVDQTAA